MKKTLIGFTLFILLSGCNLIPFSLIPAEKEAPQEEAILFQSDYEFTLEVPKSWEGYTTEESKVDLGEKVPVVTVYAPDGTALFSLTILTILQANDFEKKGMAVPGILGLTASYVVYWQSISTGPSYEADYERVQDSFKAVF
jgi:hypothetical protein